MLKLKRKAYRGIIIMFVTACFFVRHLCLEVLNGGETMKFFNKNINNSNPVNIIKAKMEKNKLTNIIN